MPQRMGQEDIADRQPASVITALNGNVVPTVARADTMTGVKYAPRQSPSGRARVGRGPVMQRELDEIGHRCHGIPALVFPDAVPSRYRTRNLRQPHCDPSCNGRRA
jgi:hypothetical protein